MTGREANCWLILLTPLYRERRVLGDKSEAWDERLGPIITRSCNKNPSDGGQVIQQLSPRLFTKDTTPWTPASSGPGGGDSGATIRHTRLKPVTDDEFLKPASSPGHNEARFMLHKIVFSDSALSVRSEEPEERAEINMSHLEPQVSIQK